MSDGNPQAALTQLEREYLKGESDIEPGTQQARNTRSRIRGRMVRAVLDFALAKQHLARRDIDLIAKAISDKECQQAIDCIEQFGGAAGTVDAERVADALQSDDADVTIEINHNA
jgi:hypothetical protein